MWYVLSGYVTGMGLLYSQLYRTAPILEDEDEKLLHWKVEEGSNLMSQAKAEVSVTVTEEIKRAA